MLWNGSFENAESAAFKSSLIKEDVARIGSFGVWSDQEIVNLDVHDEYVPLPRLKGEAGKIGFALNQSEMQDSSIGAITTDCKFPHLIARFYDYIYGNPEVSPFTTATTMRLDWNSKALLTAWMEESILKSLI